MRVVHKSHGVRRTSSVKLPLVEAKCGVKIFKNVKSQWKATTCAVCLCYRRKRK